MLLSTFNPKEACSNIMKMSFLITNRFKISSNINRSI